MITSKWRKLNFGTALLNYVKWTYKNILKIFMLLSILMFNFVFSCLAISFFFNIWSNLPCLAVPMAANPNPRQPPCLTICKKVTRNRNHVYNHKKWQKYLICTNVRLHCKRSQVGKKKDYLFLKSCNLHLQHPHTYMFWKGNFISKVCWYNIQGVFLMKFPNVVFKNYPWKKKTVENFQPIKSQNFFKKNMLIYNLQNG